MSSDAGIRRVASGLALSSGAALVAYLVAGVSLWIGLAVLISGWGILFTIRLRHAEAQQRRRLLLRIVGGMIAGLMATVCYDAARWTLTKVDPVSVNPFEAIPRFGALLLGERMSAGPTIAAGVVFHLVNGVAFGVAFALIFRSYGLLRGIAWGFGLEGFQLALYPGWLNIQAFDEFARVSALGHLAYGAVLGQTCKVLIPRLSGDGGGG